VSGYRFQESGEVRNGREPPGVDRRRPAGEIARRSLTICLQHATHFHFSPGPSFRNTAESGYIDNGEVPSDPHPLPRRVRALMSTCQPGDLHWERGGARRSGEECRRMLRAIPADGELATRRLILPATVLTRFDFSRLTKSHWRKSPVAAPQALRPPRHQLAGRANHDGRRRSFFSHLLA